MFSGDYQMTEAETRAKQLMLSEIQRVYHLPLHEAIVQLNVTEIPFKRRCRELGVLRYLFILNNAHISLKVALSKKEH
jgi:hypothetical protein